MNKDKREMIRMIGWRTYLLILLEKYQVWLFWGALFAVAVITLAEWPV